MTIIPTFQNVSSTFTQRIELEGILYILKIQWNARSEAFMLSIYDKDNTLIIAGLKLVPDYLLNYQFSYIDALPPGAFILYDLEQNPSGVVSFENLGVRYQLMYLSSEDINELQ